MNIEKYFSLRSKTKIFKKRVRKYTDYNLPFFLKKKSFMVDVSHHRLDLMDTFHGSSQFLKYLMKHY